MKMHHYILSAFGAGATLLLVRVMIRKKYDYHRLLNQSKNIKAFLKTIQFAEGTFTQPNPYAVTFGYGHLIKRFNDHPSVTGEWQGKTLNQQFCQAVNLSSGCKSTAAGAYQFIQPTWKLIKRNLTGLRFDAKGQDVAALYLLDQKNSLEDVLAGRFTTAIYKNNRTWASLPGSPFGQPTRSMAQLKTFYLNVGGTVTN